MTENDKNIIKSIVDNFTFKGSDALNLYELYTNLNSDSLTVENKSILKAIIYNSSFKGSDVPEISRILDLLS